MSYLLPSIYYTDPALDMNLSPGKIGLVLSLFPIGGVAASYYLGIYINDLGRRNAILYGGLICSLSMFLFAVDLLIKNETTFLLLGCVARLL